MHGKRLRLTHMLNDLRSDRKAAICMMIDMDGVQVIVVDVYCFCRRSEGGMLGEWGCPMYLGTYW